MNYCCENKLPDSKKDLWFSELGKLEMDNFSKDNIPSDFKNE
ncbi:DUF6980 family protein [Enterococcus sp. DIV0756]